MSETQTDKYHDGRREAREARADYHKRDVAMEPELNQRVADWAGGTDCFVRGLCSNGWSHYVSPSMIDAAADALMRPGKFPLDAELQADCDDLIGTLQDLADYPGEQRYGDDSGYATHLMSDEQREAAGV